MLDFERYNIRNLDTYYPSVNELRTGRKLRRNLIIALLIFMCLSIVGPMTAIVYFFPEIDRNRAILVAMGLLVVLWLPIIIWFRPRVGVYVIFTGSLLFPSTVTKYLPTMPTSGFPFWWNLSSTGTYVGQTSAFTGLAISPAEIIMLMTFMTWLTKTVVSRDFKFVGGAFLLPIVAYSTLVALGFANGMSRGGNLTMALYEVRAQAYFLICYIMTANLFTSEKQVIPFLWIIVVTNFVQGILGSITYFTLQGQIGAEGFMIHEESLLLNLSVLLGFIVWNLKISKTMGNILFLSIPFCLIAIMGNQRRASIAALMVAFIPLMPLLWLVAEQYRKRVITISITILIVFSIYLPIAWGSTGAWALPARALRSQTNPDFRDAASNNYRYMEDTNLKFTRDTAFWQGYGFGLPFIQLVKLPVVTTDFVYYMAHNSVLWIWMRIGTIGFYLFWMMVATVLIRGPEMLRNAGSKELKALGLLAMLMLLMNITFGKYDLALVNIRTMSLTGVFLGILGVLPRISRKPDKSKTPAATPAPEPTPVPATPPSMF